MTLESTHFSHTHFFVGIHGLNSEVGILKKKAKRKDGFFFIFLLIGDRTKQYAILRCFFTPKAVSYCSHPKTA